MASHSAELEKLAQVFMAGFRFGNAATPEDIRKVINPELLMLQRSLPEADAAAFLELIDGLIDSMTATSEPPGGGSDGTQPLQTA